LIILKQRAPVKSLTGKFLKTDFPEILKGIMQGKLLGRENHYNIRLFIKITSICDEMKLRIYFDLFIKDWAKLNIYIFFMRLDVITYYWGTFLN